MSKKITTHTKDKEKELRKEYYKIISYLLGGVKICY
jgi:hypothetical protein